MYENNENHSLCIDNIVILLSQKCINLAVCEIRLNLLLQIGNVDEVIGKLRVLVETRIPFVLFCRR